MTNIASEQRLVMSQPHLFIMAFNVVEIVQIFQWSAAYISSNAEFSARTRCSRLGLLS